MENRNGLMVGGMATRATGDAEPLAAMALVRGVAGRRRTRFDADKAYDTRDFVMALSARRTSPLTSPEYRPTRGSRIDGRTTWRLGYPVSLRLRKRIEEGFGWLDAARAALDRA